MDVESIKEIRDPNVLKVGEIYHYYNTLRGFSIIFKLLQIKDIESSSVNLIISVILDTDNSIVVRWNSGDIKVLTYFYKETGYKIYQIYE